MFSEYSLHSLKDRCFYSFVNEPLSHTTDNKRSHTVAHKRETRCATDVHTVQLNTTMQSIGMHNCRQIGQL